MEGDGKPIEHQHRRMELGLLALQAWATVLLLMLGVAGSTLAYLAFRDQQAVNRSQQQINSAQQEIVREQQKHERERYASRVTWWNENFHHPPATRSVFHLENRAPVPLISVELAGRLLPVDQVLSPPASAIEMRLSLGAIPPCSIADVSVDIRNFGNAPEWVYNVGAFFFGDPVGTWMVLRDGVPRPASKLTGFTVSELAYVTVSHAPSISFKPQEPPQEVGIVANATTYKPVVDCAES